MRLAPIIALMMALGCGAAPAASRPGARYGGALGQVGPRSVELVVHASGELHLHAAGAPDELADAGITVTLRDVDGRARAVGLRYEDPVQGFVGRIGAVPAPGEAAVLLVRDGRRASGTARVSRILPAAAHGGSVLAVGARTAEVGVDADGFAWVVLDAPPAVAVTLNLAGDDGRLHPLALAWDAEAERHVGRIEGITPRPGPLEVIVEVDGAQALGRGTLGVVDPAMPALASPEMTLELPELGSELPAVIAVPPAPAR